MASPEFIHAVKSLKSLIDEQENETSDNNLSNIFDSCLHMHSLLDGGTLSSNKTEFQEATKACIKALEKCTMMVNQLDLFSTNETFEELQTPSIRYLMLPAMLGSLTITLPHTNFLERIKFVEMAEVYFRDFLLRCKNYEVGSDRLKQNFDELRYEGSDRKVTDPRRNDPSLIRERKIEQYKQMKELDEKLKALKPALDRPDSEEYAREYYFLLLEKWILISVEEVIHLKNEKNILVNGTFFGFSSNTKPEPKLEYKPMKPFIITRNNIEKKVFGLGYPSMPVLTIDDFYRQRFQKQVEEHNANKGGTSLQDSAFNGEGLNTDDKEAEEDNIPDHLAAEKLQAQRNFDDWKDENPRGSGNRYNKG